MEQENKVTQDITLRIPRELIGELSKYIKPRFIYAAYCVFDVIKGGIEDPASVRLGYYSSLQKAQNRIDEYEKNDHKGTLNILTLKHFSIVESSKKYYIRKYPIDPEYDMSKIYVIYWSPDCYPVDSVYNNIEEAKLTWLLLKGDVDKLDDALVELDADRLYIGLP